MRKVPGGAKGRKPAEKAAGAAERPPSARPRADVAERIQAEDAFVRSGRTLAQISAAHSRSYATLRDWCRQGGWEEKRKEFLLSDGGQADILGHAVRELLLKIQAGQTLTAPVANTILQAKRAEREIRGDKYNFTQLFSITNAFLAHLRAADPSLLPLLEPHVESFLQAQKELMLPRGK